MPFKFGKKKRYSIGEKKAYFNQLLSDPTISKSKKQWANKRLNGLFLTENSIKQGDVFVLHDIEFYNQSTIQSIMNSNDKTKIRKMFKPRYGVVSKTTLNKVDIIPARNRKDFIILSKFDGNRYLDLKKKRAVTKNNLYEIRGFKKSNNAYLTRDEKWQLKLKSK